MQQHRSMSETDTAALRTLEERLAMPAASESRESLAQILAAEFRDFGISGRMFERDSVLEALTAGGHSQVRFEEFQATPLGNGTVLVAYVARSDASHGWKPASLQSSLWMRRDGRWQILCHQGTRGATEET